MTNDALAGRAGRRDLNGDEGRDPAMVVLLSAPRGRISAARLAAQRDEGEEAYGIIIRPARVVTETEPARAPRPRLSAVRGDA
ncbi:hypothetical protein [Longimicrobium sp.]|uniref:hypothetical protein n=1 Tax=Longimicrobium sp. TaxID=2029185 RepID=UPI002E355E1E|nr:hypothetical protein [Longimicrobium sp.]HEX6042780.1 hypothetical protein [Longimicrobium sp.]